MLPNLHCTLFHFALNEFSVYFVYVSPKMEICPKLRNLSKVNDVKLWIICSIFVFPFIVFIFIIRISKSIRSLRTLNAYANTGKLLFFFLSPKIIGDGIFSYRKTQIHYAVDSIGSNIYNSIISDRRIHFRFVFFFFVACGSNFILYWFTLW